MTNLVVQFTGEEFLISFFEVRPPLIVGTPEEKRVQIARVEAVEARCLTRIAVSPGRMGEFIEVMQEQLQRAKETAAERPTTEQSR